MVKKYSAVYPLGMNTGVPTVAREEKERYFN